MGSGRPEEMGKFPWGSQELSRARSRDRELPYALSKQSKRRDQSRVLCHLAIGHHPKPVLSSQSVILTSIPDLWTAPPLPSLVVPCCLTGSIFS